MLQVDPALTKLIKARKRSFASAVLTLGLLAALLLFAGKKFFSPVFPFISGGLWWFPALILLYFLSIQIAAAQEGFLRHVELRRQATARGDERFLATEQPEVNANAFSLPITMRLQPNHLPLLSAFLTPPFILVALVVIYWGVIRGQNLANANFWLVVGLFLMGLLFLSLILYWLFTTEAVQVIEVSDEGLKTRYKGQESAIRWDEARLFAFYGVFGDARGRGTQTYELSSSKIIVKWTEYQRQQRMWHLKTDQTFREYRGQMLLLNQMIMGKTSLPLYDLR